MAVAFYLDENTMDRRIVRRLRSGGIDVLTMQEARTRGRSDAEQLRLSFEMARAVVTGDVGDFADLHKQWMNEGRQHAGIVLLSQPELNPEMVADKLVRLSAARSPDDMRNAILYINADPAQRLE